MGRSCVVADCQSKSMTAGDGGAPIKMSYHEFPSDVMVRREWIDVIRHRVRGGPQRQETWMPSDMTTVCNLHFLDTDFLDADITAVKRRRLRPTAVPTVFVSQETNALQVLANQAVMEQAIQGNNYDENLSFKPLVRKTRKTYSSVPRYRREQHKSKLIKSPSEDNSSDKFINVPSSSIAESAANDEDVTESVISVDSRTFTTIEEVIAFVENGEGVEESSSVDQSVGCDGDGGGEGVESSPSNETLETENERLQAEVNALQRKLSMAQLNMKSLEKRLETKAVKKTRAMGRSYYYEKMCSKLREEVATLKAREEELLSSNLPVLSEIERQAALGDVQAMFLMQQIRHYGKGNRARPQWEDAVLEKCTAWLSKSHFSYRFAKRLGLVLLPSRSTLSRFAEWKANATAKVADDQDQPPMADHADDDQELIKRQQEELQSVEMIDVPNDNVDSMVTCMFADGDSQVTIVTLDPSMGVLEWRLDGTAQEVVEMTTTSELDSTDDNVT